MQWYYYDFGEGVSQETMDYIGYKEENSDFHSNGLFSNIINTYNCSYAGSNLNETISNKVPYFKRPSPVYLEIYQEKIICFVELYNK